MKIDSVERNIQRSDNFNERAMGLAVGSEAFVFNVLRKDLYSDPIGSLIREYTVNAQDEHRKHNKFEVPIAIKVPNTFSPELHIRDYAGGLTEEQVFEFFGNYGASDKRDSNVASGFFGLGCKSAFAYTDSYIVKSYKDGRVFTFNIYIDETEIGRVAKISDESTTEPNGVQIIVPVKTSDIATFQDKVVSTVSHFKVKPTLTGLAYKPDFNEKAALIKGDDWGFFGYGSPSVIMGEIAYPFNAYKIENLNSWERSLLDSELHIYVNIGDVQVTASREALQMSEKTTTEIRKRLISIKDEMMLETKKAFDAVTNVIDAKKLYYKVVVSGGGYSKIIRDAGELEWNGEKLTDNLIRFGDYSTHKVSTYTKRYSGRIESATGGSYLRCDEKLNLFFDDTNGVKVNYKRRAETLFAAGATSVTVLHTSDKAGLEDIIGMPVSDLPSYNDVAITKPASTKLGGTGVDFAKRSKHMAKVFQLKTDKIKYAGSGSASDFWEVKEADISGEVVYIPIERFKPTLPTIYSLEKLSIVIDSLENLGVVIDFPIYGVKKDAPDNFIRFDKWIDREIAKSGDLKEAASFIKALTDLDLADASSININALPDCVAKEYSQIYKKAKSAQQTKAYYLNRLPFTVEVKPYEKLKTLSNDFRAKYPMLKLISSYNLNSAEVTNYIIERESV